jgi:hypothetical protein
MVQQPVTLQHSRRPGSRQGSVGWSDHRTRTAALDAWLAREEAVAAGTASGVDPAQLGLPDRETLLRALFQRFATTLEGALDVELEVGDHPDRERPDAAVRTAYNRAAAHRPVDWRALRREAADPLIAELTRRQHARIAHRTGTAATDVAAVATAVARVDALALRLSPRARRRRVVPRVLARRVG